MRAGGRQRRHSAARTELNVTRFKLKMRYKGVSDREKKKARPSPGKQGKQTGRNAFRQAGYCTFRLRISSSSSRKASSDGTR